MMTHLQRKKLAFMSIVNKVKGFIRTVSGVPPLTLPACVDDKSLIDYKLYGNSVQDGTPTPDEPATVASVGDFSEVLGTMSDRHIGLGGVFYSSDGFTEPKILLEPNTTYYLRFDYVINGTNQTLYTGIGYGSTGYQYDIRYNAKYPSQDTGISSTFECSFTTPSKFNVSTPYLALRLVRTLEVAHFNVDISNIYVTKEPYGYKIPIVAKSEKGQSITTNIYLDEPIGEGESISYIKNNLPILPTFKGTTIYEVGTSVQPSNMEAVYYSTKKG